MIINDIYINPAKIEAVRILQSYISGAIQAEIETDKLKFCFYCDDKKYSHILKNLETHKPMKVNISSLVIEMSTEIKQPVKRKWWKR